MISEEIGFITLNNFSKTYDYFYAWALVIFALILNRYLLQNNKINSKKCILNFNIFPINLTSEIFVNFTLLLFAFYDFFLIFKISAIQSLFLSSLLSYFTFKRILSFNKYRNFLVVSLAYFILFFKLISTTHNIFPILFILAICTLVLLLTTRKIFLILVLLLSAKNLPFGNFFISDVFHHAEHFVAGVSLFKSGFFSIFPNIGYLEEVPSIALIKAIKIFTLNKVYISLLTARTLIFSMLLTFITVVIFEKSRIVANKYCELILILLLFIVPVDRISPLFAILYSLLALDYSSLDIDSVKKKVTFLLLALLPFVLLSLSPIYFIFIIFAFILNIKEFKAFRWTNLCLYFAWTLFTLFLYRDFKNFISIYSDISSLFSEAFTLPLYISKVSSIFLMSILFVYVVILILRLVDDEVKKRAYSIIQNLMLVFVISKFIGYSFGRIDADALSGRLFSLSIPFLIIIFYRTQTKVSQSSLIIPFILFLFYSNISLPEHIDAKNFQLSNYREKFADLSQEIKAISDKINKFANSKPVINYAAPALSFAIQNNLTPEFTSPYVTIGEPSQKRLVDFLSKNNSAIIFLGTQNMAIPGLANEFITFDGVDIRTRVPLIFKYISKNYNYVIVDGLIYAVPFSNELKSKNINIFFSGFNLKKSVLYFNRHKNTNVIYNIIIIDCINNKAGQYIINNEKNSFYAELECGSNFIPAIFFDGKIVSYRLF
jgi:hypothetical protein